MWQSRWSCPYGRQNGRNCSNHPWPRIQSQFWTSTLNFVSLSPIYCYPSPKRVTKIVTDWVMPKLINTCHPLLFLLYSPLTLPHESYLWVIHLYLYLFHLRLMAKKSKIFKKSMHMNFIHQPIPILSVYTIVLEIVRVVNQSVITKTVFVPCFRSS